MLAACLLSVGSWLVTEPATAQPVEAAGMRETAPHVPPAGGGVMPLAHSDRLSREVMDRIGNRITDNRDALRQRAILPRARGASAPSFAFPLASRSGRDHFHATSNFVDHDPEVNDRVEDYNCGTRTYDTAEGYNHRGVDLVLWPFAWRTMDLGQVEVVAAAAGTIVARVDGNPDRSCSFSEDEPNYVSVEHSDGSLALYLHMKSGSLTSKLVGESVAEGEYLGLVGSSGSSTSPHLHFEVWDGSEPGNLVDPFAGLCNQLNASSWWQNQPPYYDSRINLLATHDDAPEFPACPEQETPNFERVWQRAGEQIRIYTAAYYRDQRGTHTTNYSILRPDGTLYQTWSHSPTANHASASYWYWFWDVAAAEPEGRWTLRADYQGEVVEHSFYIDPLFAATFDTGTLTEWD